MEDGLRALSGEPTWTPVAHQVHSSALPIVPDSLRVELTLRALLVNAGGFAHAKVWHGVLAEAVRNVCYILPVYDLISRPFVPRVLSSRPSSLMKSDQHGLMILRVHRQEFWRGQGVRRVVETVVGTILYQPFRKVLNRLQAQTVRPGHLLACFCAMRGSSDELQASTGGVRYTGLFQGLQVAWKTDGWRIFTRNMGLEIAASVSYTLSQDIAFSLGYSSLHFMMGGHLLHLHHHLLTLVVNANRIGRWLNRLLPTSNYEVSYGDGQDG